MLHASHSMRVIVKQTEPGVCFEAEVKLVMRLDQGIIFVQELTRLVRQWKKIAVACSSITGVCVCDKVVVQRHACQRISTVKVTQVLAIYRSAYLNITVQENLRYGQGARNDQKKEGKSSDGENMVREGHDVCASALLMLTPFEKLQHEYYEALFFL